LADAGGGVDVTIAVDDAGGVHPDFAAMPANSWLDLGVGWRGGHEVPAVFDQANHLFFKYGGCGDATPPVNISFPVGDPRYPNGYSNTLWVFDLGRGQWVLRRPYDASWPADRPANGCSRNYTYDSLRRVIWMYGGVSDGGGGGDVWDLWSYDGASDTFAQSNSTGRPPGGDSNGGDVFVHDTVNDVLVMPRGASTWIYRPASNAWEQRATPGGPGEPGHYSRMVFDPVTARVIFPRAVPTGNTATSLTSGMDPDQWRPRSGGYDEFRFETWAYDAATNTWSNLAPATAPRPVFRMRFGLTYDSRNQQVILIGGSSNTWDELEQWYNDVWTFDTATNTWSMARPQGSYPTGFNAWRDLRHCAYDAADNVVLWMPSYGNLWAYRYR
jgi:hypothetical protein